MLLGALEGGGASAGAREGVRGTSRRGGGRDSPRGLELPLEPDEPDAGLDTPTH